MARLVILMLLAAPGSLVAQETRAWNGLRTSNLTTVEVTDDRGERTTGKLLRLDQNAVVLIVDGTERQLEMSHVTEVLKHGDSLKNGAITGAIVGAGFGFLAAGLADCSHDDGHYGSCGFGTKFTFVTLNTALYTAIGVGIDALIQGRTVLYRAPTPQIAVSRDGVAVRMAVTW
jgi:hypothetical protein